MFTPGKEALHWNWLVVAPCSLCRNRQEGRQKKGNHDWRLEPEKEPLSRNYKSAKCIIKSLCMQAHPIILRGGLHMSCHYQPLIVPSQHFSIYSDSSVPSGRYAWLTKQVRRLDVFLRHYSWYSLGESEILDYTFPSRQINNPSDLNCLIYATFWAILLHNEWTVFLKV